VVGHQWWWEYRYDHYDGKALDFIAANELHVPAGANGVARPVYLKLQSADVCHSFWVPRLGGKTDLIPATPMICGSKRTSRGCTSASVPNIVARNTPTCSSA